MISSLVILSPNGKSIFQKEYDNSLNVPLLVSTYTQARSFAENSSGINKNHYNHGLNVSGDTLRTYHELEFSLNGNEPMAWLSPIVSYNGATFVQVQDELTILAICTGNTNAAGVISLLETVITVCKQFFGSFDEASITSNFFTLYEVIDEIIDGGFSQLTESSMITKFLTDAPDIKKTVSSALNTSVPWRASRIKHRRNEMWLDVIEKIEALVGVHGETISSGIIGEIRAKSHLSGMPEVVLTLSRAKLSEGMMREAEFDSSEFFEDIRFHQCVRLNKYEADKIISFIPPDGEFELMTYKVKRDILIDLPFNINCNIPESAIDPTASKIEYIVTVDSKYNTKITAENLYLEVPTPAFCCKPKFRPTSGTVSFKPESNTYIWHIKCLPGSSNFMLTASITRQTTGTDLNDRWYKKPVQVNFDIPFYTATGLRVRTLKVFEASGYPAVPWARYITKNSNYQVRIR